MGRRRFQLAADTVHAGLSLEALFPSQTKALCCGLCEAAPRSAFKAAL